MLGMKPFAIYDVLKRYPGQVPTERVSRTIAIRLEDLPNLRDLVEEGRIRRENVKRGMTPDGIWLTSRGAAERLGVSVRTIRRWTEEGRIKGWHLREPGDRPEWRWNPADIDQAKLDQAS